MEPNVLEKVGFYVNAMKQNWETVRTTQKIYRKHKKNQFVEMGIFSMCEHRQRYNVGQSISK
jgi:hypothetical protein